MNKIKIAHVITRLDRGGAPDIVNIIFDQIDRSRYELKLICGATSSPSFRGMRLMKGLGGNLFYIPQLKREINPLDDLIAFFKLYSIFRKEKFDIVHTHTSKAGALSRIAAKLASAPKVVHMPHGNIFYGYFNPILSGIVVILEKFSSLFTDKIIVLTELEKKELLKFKITSPKKIIVVNSGLDLDTYRFARSGLVNKREELHLEAEVNLVGIIGRLEPVKGPEYFMEAARIVGEKFPKVKFLIVGDGSLKNKLENECKKMMMQDKCLFTGWREDVPGILAILDILVLPSLNEAVGRVLIEAGACGVPVVATNVGGVPEIVKNGETGILVPPKDAHSLAKAIIDLLEDKEKRIKMGQAAKSWVDDKFSAQRMVRNIFNLYSELVKK